VFAPGRTYLAVAAVDDLVLAAEPPSSFTNNRPGSLDIWDFGQATPTRTDTITFSSTAGDTPGASEIVVDASGRFAYVAFARSRSLFMVDLAARDDGDPTNDFEAVDVSPAAITGITGLSITPDGATLMADSSGDNDVFGIDIRLDADGLPRNQLTGKLFMSSGVQPATSFRGLLASQDLIDENGNRTVGYLSDIGDIGDASVQGQILVFGIPSTP